MAYRWQSDQAESKVPSPDEQLQGLRCVYLKEIYNVKETMEKMEEEAFAKIVAAHILFPIVGPAPLVPLILNE